MKIIAIMAMALLPLSATFAGDIFSMANDEAFSSATPTSGGSSIAEMAADTQFGQDQSRQAVLTAQALDEATAVRIANQTTVQDIEPAAGPAESESAAGND